MLGIPELLESVLSHLETLELFRSQRVCRRWQNIIQPSPGLMKRTFLIPDEKETIVLKFSHDNRSMKDTIYHNLRRQPVDWNSYMLHPNIRYSGSENYGYSQYCPKTRLLDNYVTLQVPGDDLRLPIDVRPVKPSSAHEISEVSHQLQSWSKMLVCQPPCKRLAFEIRHAGKLQHGLVTSDNGGTMGQLWDAVWQEARKYPRVSRTSELGRKWYYWKCKLSWRIDVDTRELEQ